MIVTRLDRLARSTRDLLNTLAAIGAAKATFQSLHDTFGTMFRSRRVSGIALIRRLLLALRRHFGGFEFGRAAWAAETGLSNIVLGRPITPGARERDFCPVS